MPVEHRNRKGHVYRLYAGRRKDGSPNYFVAKRPTDRGEPVETVPEGYEIHEDPETARVSVRKARPKRTLESERELVEQIVARLAPTKYTLVDEDEQGIVVYVSDYVFEDLDQVREMFGARGVDHFARRGAYSKALRFVPLDEDERLFRAERWCLRLDGFWVNVSEGELPELVEEYAPLIGPEDVDDLFGFPVGRRRAGTGKGRRSRRERRPPPISPWPHEAHAVGVFLRRRAP